MLFEGVNFYPVAFEKTEAEFVEHESATGLTPDQLKECYRLVKKPVKAKKNDNSKSIDESESIEG